MDEYEVRVRRGLSVVELASTHATLAEARERARLIAADGFEVSVCMFSGRVLEYYGPTVEALRVLEHYGPTVEALRALDTLIAAVRNASATPEGVTWLQEALAAYERTGDHNHGRGPIAPGGACEGGDCWVDRARRRLADIDAMARVLWCAVRGNRRRPGETWLDVRNTCGVDEADARRKAEDLARDCPGYDADYPVLRFAQISAREVKGE